MLQQPGEQVAAEVAALVSLEVVEDIRLEDVDARVDRVAEHLAPGGLLDEALHAPLVVGDHHAVLQGVVGASQDEGGERVVLGVVAQRLAEVDVGEGVAADEHEGVVEVLLDALHAPGRPQRGLFDRVDDLDAPLRAIAEVRDDLVGEVVEGHDDGLDAVPLEQLDDVLHHRLVAQPYHGLGSVEGERAQARAFSTSHDHSLHRILHPASPASLSRVSVSWRAFPVRDLPKGASACRRPTQRWASP